MSWLDKIKEFLKELWEKIKPSDDDQDDPVTPPVDPVEPPEPGTWPLACTKIHAMMVTPMFVYKDLSQVKSQAKAIKAAGYNAIDSLVDLQSGRNYIFPGRNATELVSSCLGNIKAVLDAGLTPIIIVRNDWAVRTKTGVIPSINGQPSTQEGFYTAALLASEKQFLTSMKSLYPYVHFQLSIEPEVSIATDFALNMAKFLRSEGFTGRLLINPTGQAMTSYQTRKSEFDQAKCEVARSWHAATPSPDVIWNTDGRTDITSSNAQSVLTTIKASKDEWIFWSSDIANSPNGIPAGYLTSTTTTPVQTGTNTFLWKPVADTDGGRLVVLTPANLEVKTLTVNGEKGNERPRANGNRQHWRYSKTGSAYGNNVKVVASLDSGASKTWTIPNGGVRYEK